MACIFFGYVGTYSFHISSIVGYLFNGYLNFWLLKFDVLAHFWSFKGEDDCLMSNADFLIVFLCIYFLNSLLFCKVLLLSEK